MMPEAIDLKVIAAPLTGNQLKEGRKKSAGRFRSAARWAGFARCSGCWLQACNAVHSFGRFNFLTTCG
jgi:hypothetical protein